MKKSTFLWILLFFLIAIRFILTIIIKVTIEVIILIIGLKNKIVVWLR